MAGQKPESEHIEQVRFVAWFEKNHPGVKIYAVPNGGHRHIRTGQKLKLEGVRPGVPDLCIPEWFVYIEMKPERGGVVSKQQKEWLHYLQGIGYATRVCRGFNSAKTFIEAVKRQNDALDAARELLKARADAIQ